MIKKYSIICLLSMMCLFVNAQSISRSVISSAGAYFNNANFNVSSSLGETFSATLSNGNIQLSQGFEQPAAINTAANVNITLFIEGFYLGANTMISSITSQTVQTPVAIADNIVVKLHNSVAPYTLAFSENTSLNTDGTATILFPAGAVGNNYYIVVKHRNSIETWSASPVTINSTNTNYNFSDAITKAYGDNLKDMGDGIFAMYSGDINQDGSIDFDDYPSIDVASMNGDIGYYATDITGDGSVDFNDYPILDINSMNGIIAITP